MNKETAQKVIERDGQLGHQFPKGVSGNPSGRPKGNPKVKELLKANSEEAAKVLIGLLNSEVEKIRFMAAQEILNRTEGKPMQAVNMEVSGSMDMGAQIRQILLGESKDAGGQNDGVGTES